MGYCILNVRTPPWVEKAFSKMFPHAPGLGSYHIK